MVNCSRLGVPTTLTVCLLLGSISSLSTLAQGPTETLVVVNKDSLDSIALARRFQRLHGIPDINMVRLSLSSLSKPEAKSLEIRDIPIEITTHQFLSVIWKPITAEMNTRGINREILACVYSCHFPIRIAVGGEHKMSLTGLTFVRGNVPEHSQILNGSYLSPYFAGPVEDKEAQNRSRSLDRLRIVCPGEIPLASMMLGYTGERGNSIEEAAASMERGAAASRSNAPPAGKVFFVLDNDIRSKTRAWQYKATTEALTQQGIACVNVSNAVPQGANVIGLFSGKRHATAAPEAKFLPGAYADHLTSFGAAFDTPAQEKISKWIRLGATASAGAVTEPMANWRKFPHARLFSHLANGCTMLEALVQSTASPLQILYVGDPLTAPYAPGVTLTLSGLPENRRIADVMRLSATVTGAKSSEYSRFRWYINGKQAGYGANTTLHFNRRPAGVYELLCVARRQGLVRDQVWWKKRLIK